MKSIILTRPNLLECNSTLHRLSLVHGDGCQIRPPNRIELEMDAIDGMIEQYLKQVQVPTVADEPPAEPERCDRGLQLTIQNEVELMRAQLQYIRDSWKTPTESLRELDQAKAAIRLSIVQPVAQGDVVHGKTIVYGGALEGAEPGIIGKAQDCEVLIHLGHALDPEDLYERERRKQPRKIYRYCVPGLDDYQWQSQVQPLRWPPTAQEYRNLAYQRFRKLEIS